MNKWLVLLLVFTLGQATADILNVGMFDEEGSGLPEPWRIIRFDETVPATRYRVTVWDGVNAIEAEADGSMALLARPLAVNLEQTPVLCWRWRVDGPLINADMAKKSGDDYAARVYLTFTLPPESLSLWVRTKLRLARAVYGSEVPDAAINYVWDNRYPVGTLRTSLYTDRSKMMVLRTGARDAKKWIKERRNILADTDSFFGAKSAHVRQLAIGVDTDNTGEKARAGFADLHFVSLNQPCAFP